MPRARARFEESPDFVQSLARGLEVVRSFDEEHPVLIKTTRACYAALEAAIREAHPYELPEIIAVPIEHGLAAYLAWVAAETTPPG